MMKYSPILLLLFIISCNNKTQDINFDYLLSLLKDCQYEKFKEEVIENNYQLDEVNTFTITLLYGILPVCKLGYSYENNDWNEVNKSHPVFDIITFIVKHDCDINHIDIMDRNVLYNNYDYPSALYALVENEININYVYRNQKTILGILIDECTNKFYLSKELDSINNYTIQKLMSIAYLIEKGGKLSNQSVNPYEYLLEESKKRPLLYEYLIENGLPKPDVIKGNN